MKNIELSKIIIETKPNAPKTQFLETVISLVDGTFHQREIFYKSLEDAISALDWFFFSVTENINDLMKEDSFSENEKLHVIDIVITSNKDQLHNMQKHFEKIFSDHILFKISDAHGIDWNFVEIFPDSTEVFLFSGIYLEVHHEINKRYIGHKTLYLRIL